MKWVKQPKTDMIHTQEQYILYNSENLIELGKIYLFNDEDWFYEYENNAFILDVKTLEEAKKEFMDIYRSFCACEISYYERLKEKLENELYRMEKNK